MAHSLGDMDTLEAVASAAPLATESDELRDRAMVLEQEATRLRAQADATRREALQLRAKADRLDDPERGVRAPTPARTRVRRDGLMAAAGVAVESLPAIFASRDLAAALGIADVQRADRLLAALADFGKVERTGDGWRSVDPDEAAVRDFVAAQEAGFTFGDVMAAVSLPESDVSAYMARFRERGLVQNVGGGGFVYLPAPGDSSPRPRRKPPEKDPPAYTDAPAGRGEPVRIVDHGKRATATSRHREKLRDKRHDEIMSAREEAAERARAKAEKTKMRPKRRRK